MKSNGKIIFIVLDGVGIGELPDAHIYGDTGTNTLSNTADVVGGLKLPTMEGLGLGNIHTIQGVQNSATPKGCFGKMQEVSKGKDSTTGHWELSGIIIKKDFPYYPNGFPQKIIDQFLTLTQCKGILGNTVASGTQIIEELGDEHVRTGFPIIYTSADSVFQIAAHEEVIPLSQLYTICEIVREKIMVDEHAVGRIIARPFVGKSGSYSRTTNRKDFSLQPPSETILDVLFQNSIPTISIGKIDDLFAGRGISKSIHTKSNAEGIEQIIIEGKKMQCGFLMANLVDFDTLYGHRQDPKGMAGALEYFDSQLPRIMEILRDDDILIITADHGNDPTDKSTDHSREYVPLLCYSKNGKHGVDLGTRSTFADAGKTVAEYFGVENKNLSGKSFLSLLK